MKYLGDKTKIDFDNVGHYKKFWGQLLRSNAQFHTYSIDEDKILAAVLKVLIRFDTQEIIQELKDKGIKAISCTEIQRDHLSKYPIYKITFLPEVTLKNVRKTSGKFPLSS